MSKKTSLLFGQLIPQKHCPTICHYRFRPRRELTAVICIDRNLAFLPYQFDVVENSVFDGGPTQLLYERLPLSGVALAVFTNVINAAKKVCNTYSLI